MRALLLRHRTAGCLLAAALLAVLPAWSQSGQVALHAGGHRLTAELAMSDEARKHGLMHREALPADHGMLFVYPAPGPVCMWMKNTLIPLSVAFLDARGVILNIADMQPGSLERHCSASPASYALEMNLGWFGRRRLAPGMRIEGLSRLGSGP